ncbi:MAG: Nucleoside-diphosphate-sugar epimerase [Myxococcaceae bacterium]|nr:Nucleoside-diphosphate-sugar epimerase [Myxococcaceae bacterium]
MSDAHPATSVLILGCGYAGAAVARRARAAGQAVLATVRSPDRATLLRDEGFSVIEAPQLDLSIARHVGGDTHVVIGFPPDGVTDALIAPALATARAVTYISSTGVYGDRTGKIDARTPLPSSPTERAARILHAEAQYRAIGATVLRCPGIYGPTRGLHMRILRGEHRIPGDGSRHLSRIHIDDLAAFALGAIATRGITFVVGDLEPAPHIDVVRYVCDTYGVPLPPALPWQEVHETLRADRLVDSSYARFELGVSLRYPSYREGMSPEATGIKSAAG